jgi:hypothetical protein
MKYIFTSIVLYALVSCGTETQESQPNKTTEKVVANDSLNDTIDSTFHEETIEIVKVSSLTPEDIKSLNPYLNKSQISKLVEAIEITNTRLSYRYGYIKLRSD